MGPFGIPWNTFCLFLFGVVGCPVIAELIIRSKWWKEKSEYYWSFNQSQDENK